MSAAITQPTLLQTLPLKIYIRDQRYVKIAVQNQTFFASRTKCDNDISHLRKAKLILDSNYHICFRELSNLSNLFLFSLHVWNEESLYLLCCCRKSVVESGGWNRSLAKKTKDVIWTSKTSSGEIFQLLTQWRQNNNYKWFLPRCQMSSSCHFAALPNSYIYYT